MVRYLRMSSYIQEDSVSFLVLAGIGEHDIKWREATRGRETEGVENMSRLQLVRLTKSFGAETVVRAVDFSAEQGEFVVLLGPSGCGKTSTLRMIAGLENISAGELYFDGRLMNAEPPDRRNVGMVFQNYALYPHMTIFDNLAFGLRSKPSSRPRRERRLSVTKLVEDTAELLEISHLLTHRPRQLSGGQRQRVALGRALVRNPDVFLMDEPLSNLDANLRDRMRMELAQLHQRHPVTTIYVTHDQGEALTLADRIVVMNNGTVSQIGSPTEIYERPANAFVANFVGTPGMNLWTLPWQRTNEGSYHASRIRLAGETARAIDEIGTSVTVGVRPEHFLRSTGHESSGLTVECKIELIERLGSHLLAHCSMEDPRQSAPSTLVARFDSESKLARGDYLRLSAPMHRVHLFEAASGDCIDQNARVAVTA